MKIGIVLHPYGEDKPAGLARTIFEFTKGMIAVDEENEYVMFLKHRPRVTPVFAGKRWKIEILGDGYLWLDRLRHATPCDCYLFNTPVMPLFFRPRRAIVLALDFAYIVFPPKGIKGWLQNMFTRWYHWFSLRRADTIVAISQATKKDVISFFGIPEKRVQVVLCGFKNVCAISEEVIGVPEHFFLFVGIVKARKNVFNVVRAFNEFKNKHLSDYKLVIAGNAQGEYADRIRGYIQKEGIGDDVIFIGHLNDGELSYLYRKAFVLVFPSFIEGFGYPVLEAMACGLPVITSRFTSLGEICANGSALLVDPVRVNEIREAMQEIATKPDVREQLVRNGYAQAKKFSWEKAAGELLKIIKGL